jgi:hypothetical protein
MQSYYYLELATQFCFKTYGGNIETIQDKLKEQFFTKQSEPYSKYKHIQVRKGMWDEAWHFPTKGPEGKTYPDHKIHRPFFENKTIKGKNSLVFEIGIDYRNPWEMEEDFRDIIPRKPKGITWK